jgi:peptide/nickel transport system substrate-binding protein
VKRLVSILALAAAVSGVAGGCAGSSATVPLHPAGLKTGGTLIVGMVGDLTYADPAVANDITSTYVANQVVQGLVGLEPGTNSVVIPVLASGLPSVSDNGLSYTFKLRTGIEFQDGTDFDASAVKFNYDRWNAFPKGDLQNAASDFRAVFGGFGQAGNLASVDTPDAQTVVITLRKPQSNFLISQANVAFGILSPSSISANDGNNPSLAKNPYAQGTGGQGKAMVGTGPFEFSERVPGDHVSLVRNPSYWDHTSTTYLDGIVFKPFADAASATKALQDGSVDMIDAVDPASLKAISGSKNLAVLDRGNSCDLTQLAMNDGDTVNGAGNLLSQSNVRLAIASALNRQSYVTDVYAGAATVADDWLPEGALYYKPEYLPAFDVNRAKGYMTAAGLAGAKPSIDLWYPTAGTPLPLLDPKALASNVSTDLAGIGITANLKTEPAATFNADVAAGKLPMWISSTTCVWDSADFFLNTAFFHYVVGAGGTSSPNTEFNYTNDALNTTMSVALSATDEATVKAAWQKAQDLVAADMPTVPLLNARLPAAARSYVRGVVGSGNMVEGLASVWLDK